MVCIDVAAGDKGSEKSASIPWGQKSTHARWRGATGHKIGENRSKIDVYVLGMTSKKFRIERVQERG